MAEPQTSAPFNGIQLTPEQFDALLARVGTAAPAMDADALAKAFAKAQRPENPAAPMVSVFNPRGETAHPKPALRCRTFQNGILLDRDTLTWEEIEALNALPPGSFRVAKANGQFITLTVTHTTTLDGQTLDRVEIAYPCKGEDRTDHRGLLEYCLSVLESAGKTEDVERITALKRELDQARRQAVA